MPERGKDGAEALRLSVANSERLGAIENVQKVDHERLGMLEKSFQGMSGLPTTVSALSQKVEGLEKSMIREVDGLREQQKAHKMETGAALEKGFQEIREQEKSHKETLSLKFDHMIALQKERQSGWRDVLQTLGSIAVGLAVIAEAIKAFVH